MRKVTVYTDGSKYPKYSHIGLGAYCKHEDSEYRYSLNLEQDLFKEWADTSDNVSNPTAELGAAAAILYEFSLCKVPVHVEIVADYIGVKEWSEGNWKANKPYIRYLLHNIKWSTTKIRLAGGEVSYRHMKGHQKGDSPDILGNNESDVMAKSLIEQNDFKHLIQLINDGFNRPGTDLAGRQGR